MDDLRPGPTQGWSAAKEALKDRLRLLLAAIGVLTILGIVFALTLPDRDAPSRENFERCLEQAAEKAQGAVAIFNALRSAKCDKLKPPPMPATGPFNDLVPANQPLPNLKPFNGELDKPRSASEFLDSPLKPVTDPTLLKQLNGPANRPRTFHGYICTTDCSGHAAGYRWAQRKNIDDEDDCTGKSQSFVEGCLAYVEELR